MRAPRPSTVLFPKEVCRGSWFGLPSQCSCEARHYLAARSQYLLVPLCFRTALD